MAVEPNLLREIPLFAPLTDEQRAAVPSHLETRHVDAGAHLSSEGGAGYFFFVIAEGSAEVTRAGEILAEFGPGDFFGEAAIFRHAAAHRDRHRDRADHAVRDVRRRLRQADRRHPGAARRDRGRARRPSPDRLSRVDPCR